MGVLWEYLSEKAAEHPKQILREGKRQVTYTELLGQVEALAKQLIPHRKYGIRCDSEMNCAIGILACFSAGAIATPMSKRYGIAHCKKIITSIQFSWMITDNGIEQFHDETPEQDDLTGTAIIMCTSGTTGTPKGVKLSEQNLLSNMLAIQNYEFWHRLLFNRFGGEGL